MRYFSGTVLLIPLIGFFFRISSAQSGLLPFITKCKGNRTWERAVYEYANGNPKEALYTLGYILHLIEDAAVPDHTRDDPHAHDMRRRRAITAVPWKNTPNDIIGNNFNIADNLKNNGYKPIVFE